MRTSTLGHCEGRFWPDRHYHVTLMTAANAFLPEQRLAPKAPEQHSPLPDPRRSSGRPEVLDRTGISPPARQTTHHTTPRSRRT